LSKAEELKISQAAKNSKTPIRKKKKSHSRSRRCRQEREEGRESGEVCLDVRKAKFNGGGKGSPPFETKG